MQAQGEGKLSVLHPLRRPLSFHVRRKAFNSSHPQQLFLTVPAARTARQVSVSGKYGTLHRRKIFVWIGTGNCGYVIKKLVFPKYAGMRIGIRRIAAEDKDWLVFDCFKNIRQDMGAEILKR